MGDFASFHAAHPFGTALLARDTPANRKLFPSGPFGNVDIAENSCALTGECPHYHHTEDRDESVAIDVPIHMLVAAFRDKLCSRTIHNAFTRATNPKRVFIRIIDQTQPGSNLVDDEGCWPRYCSEYNSNCEEYRSQVRSVRIDSAKSLGPTWARAKLSAMINWDYIHRNDPDEIDLAPVQLEDWCMQLDSHMDFSDGYDQGLIQMFHRTENDYAVLSTYVADIEQNNQDPKTVPNLCMVTFTSSIRNWGTKDCRGLQKPKMTNAMWGAGLSFHRCHAEINVPVDPYLDGVFDGEEGSRGIRFFTHGYDVYTPDKVLVTHDYHTHQSNPVVHTWGRGRGKHNEKSKEAGNVDEDSRSERTLFEDSWKWMADIDSKRDEWHTIGSKRVNMLLNIGSYHNSTKREAEEVEKIRHSRYGLGTKRTLEQVREFTGINLVDEKMEENRCGNLNWIPFEESSNYGTAESLARALGANDGALPTPPNDKAAPRNVESQQKMLRSLGSRNSESATDAKGIVGSSEVLHEPVSDYRIPGGIVVVALLIALLSSVQRNRKHQRHYD